MLGKKLRKLRQERGLSQVKLANLLYVRSYTISDWENGRSEPSCNDLKKLCVTLMVSADELLELETPDQIQKVINDFYKKAR